MPAQHDAISREEMHRPYSRLVSDYCPCLPTQKSTCATTTSPAGETWLLWRQWASTESGNIHVGQGVSEADFVAMRESRDATLAMPTLILPSLQVNMRAGHLPPLDRSGRLFLKVPINAFGGPDIRPLAADS